MLCLAPPSGKTEYSTECSDSSLQSSSKGLSNRVLYSFVFVPVLNLRMLKVACLQGHNVILYYFLPIHHYCLFVINSPFPYFYPHH